MNECSIKGLDANKTLKLDASFRPLEIVDSLEALVLCLIGKAYAVENYSKVVNSVSDSFKLPSVIVLTRLVKFRYNTLSCKRQNVIWRDKNVCQYCSCVFTTEQLTVDHIIPRSKGGLNTWENLVAACKKCNQKKGDNTPEQANMKLIKRPIKPKSSLLKNISKNQISHLWKDYLWEKYDE